MTASSESTTSWAMPAARAASTPTTASSTTTQWCDPLTVEAAKDFFFAVAQPFDLLRREVTVEEQGQDHPVHLAEVPGEEVLVSGNAVFGGQPFPGLPMPGAGVGQHSVHVENHRLVHHQTIPDG